MYIIVINQSGPSILPPHLILHLHISLFQTLSFTQTLPNQTKSSLPFTIYFFAD
ncbi:hypothetical protein M8C21_024601 [Ambrosia artemisiifolia]|uniref:Uncharacterized protein n=1 Tax=Ambrosia artemisiifolia TaxID=4212 RepID=A0AAD5CW50_AMBAR|nr:hypothetical protein M8C21_024601 [Ambrosia artemisiifolia]